MCVVVQVCIGCFDRVFVIFSKLFVKIVSLFLNYDVNYNFYGLFSTITMSYVFHFVTMFLLVCVCVCVCVYVCVCVCVCVCVILCTLSFVLLEIKKIQSSAKQSANISQGPLSLGASAGGFQKSLVPLRGGLSKPGSLKRGSNYSMSHSVKF